jgi:glycine/D-amino acid oxidase-like deaminating enzyme
MDAQIVIVGGGFYGCCLALYLRSISDRIVLVERHDELLTEASRINQARVHFGFHYPRSFVTALRSRELSVSFARDFEPAVVSDFQMLYAVARHGSKVSTERFSRMFEDMRAPIAPAAPTVAALFASELIAGVFDCTEYAFDWTALRDHLAQRLEASGVRLITGAEAVRVYQRDGYNILELGAGGTIRSELLFNVTYGGLNRLPLASGFAPLPLKYELAEVALVDPPEELAGKAVTVMDGPFFSMMPFPAQQLYSLTHVRYTPHRSWTDTPGEPYRDRASHFPDPPSRWKHMVADAARYMPCLTGTQHRQSLFTAKTVLTRNERDDGRPILLHCHSVEPPFFSVMGGKIDNIYDLFEILPGIDRRFAGAHTSHLFGRG